MSEETIAAPTPADMPQQQPEAEAEAAPPEHTQEEFDELLKKMRSENHKLRSKLRETEPLARKAQEAEEASKSELQKALERAQEAINAKTQLETQNIRLELAVSHQLPPESIDLIGAGTREEMETNAKYLAALHAAASKTQPPPTDRPVEGLRPGASPEPGNPPDDSYPSDWKPSWMRGDDENRSFHGQ
jgi:hypothetical protein